MFLFYLLVFKVLILLVFIYLLVSNEFTFEGELEKF